MSKKFTVLAISTLLVSSVSIGCVGRFPGGGFIDSTAGAPHKATFGFVIDATEPDEFGNPTVVKGQFQFNDHGAKVAFHVDQLGFPVPFRYARIYPDLNFPEAFIIAYSGTYSSKDGTGTVEFGVASDRQEFFGTSNQDAVFVSVLSGPYAGYDNAGLVKGGNVQFLQAK